MHFHISFHFKAKQTLRTIQCWLRKLPMASKRSKTSRVKMQRLTHEHTRCFQPFVINNPLTVASESPMDLRQHDSIFKNLHFWEGQIQLHQKIENNSSVCWEQGKNLSLLEAFSFIQETHWCDLRSEGEGDQQLLPLMYLGALGVFSCVNQHIQLAAPRLDAGHEIALASVCFHLHREPLADPKCIPVLS